MSTSMPNLSLKRTNFLCYLVLCVVSTLNLLVYLFPTIKNLEQIVSLKETINYVAITNFPHATYKNLSLSNVSVDTLQISGATKPEVTRVKNVSNFRQEVKDMISSSILTLNDSANTATSVEKPESKLYIGFVNYNNASRTTVWEDVINSTFSDVSLFLRKPKTALPIWLEDYVSWHANTLRSLDTTNWQSHRYLIARCLKAEICCGASDRLKSTPFLLRLASLHKRLLFYHWEQPAPLQTFLQPPSGGVNWTIPYWLLPHLNFSESSVVEKTRNSATLLQLLTEQSNQSLIDVRPKTGNGGDKIYNSMLNDNEPSFSEIFQDIWSIMFEPSPPVARLIYRHMQDLGLQPGMYTSVHIRVTYPTELDKNRTLMTQNALKCANQIDPVANIYVTADIPAALVIAYQFGQDYLDGRVKIRPAIKTLHLDYKQSTDPEQYYDTFVDLYLIAFSKCVSFGVGGFGYLGRDLSFNPSCSISHKHVTCELNHTLGKKL